MELERLKQYLGINEEDKDMILQFVISEVEELIRNYCNVDEVPEGLLNTSYRMAADLYRRENVGQEEGGQMVASITEGDTSVSFRQAGTEIRDTIMQDYKPLLNRHRRVVFR